MAVAKPLATFRRRSAVNQEEAAFEALVADALPRVYGYLLRRCGGDAATAEDLTQETFIAAARRFAAGDAVEHPVAWLFGIARHKLIDHVRAAAASRRHSAAWFDEAGEIAAPEADAPAGIEREVVEALILRLPESQRIALTLRYFDDLSVPEVAAHLGRSVHATESLLARGRANLKAHLSSLSENGHV